MNDTTTNVVLTEAAAINEARLVIERAQKETWARFSTAMDAHDAYRLGKLHEALEEASEALFNALNVAANHCLCDESKRAINDWLSRNESPSMDEVTA